MGQKGSRAELEVARLIEPWWRQLEPEATFVRTPRSGGWREGRDLFDARGDLMVKGASRFPWLVEVKRRERWSLSNLEEGRASPMWGWWQQACEDALLASRRPMLWARQSRRDWIVLVPAVLGRMPRADFLWSFALPLPSGCLHPAGYWADALLSTPPRRWAR